MPWLYYDSKRKIFTLGEFDEAIRKFILVQKEFSDYVKSTYTGEMFGFYHSDENDDNY